jgi:hypothetical protein
METRKIMAILVLALGLIVCQAEVSKAVPAGSEQGQVRPDQGQVASGQGLVGHCEVTPERTTFTYRGQLLDVNSFPDGYYDFQFRLFDDANVIDGYQVGSDVIKTDVEVVDGCFTVELDFGDVFDGNDRWLEIGVRLETGVRLDEFSGLEEYTTIEPRVLAGTVNYIPKYITTTTFGNSVIYQSPGNNIGIGTTSPTDDIDVHPSSGSSWIRVKSDTSFAGLIIDRYDTDDNGYIIYRTDGTGQWYVGQIGSGGSNNDFAISTSYSPADGKFYIKQNGKVGIGTSSPFSRAMLHVYGNAPQALTIENKYPTLFLKETDGSANKNFQIRVSNGKLLFTKQTDSGIGGSTRLAILQNGKVGIGTTSPSTTLEVQTSSGSPVELQRTGTGARRWQFQITNKGYFQINDSSASADRITINTSGGVGIGTANPKGKIDVNGSIYQRGILLEADYVFDPSYTLESIDEHSEFMWKHKHLPAMPKSEVDENGREIVEIGAHRKGIIEELEKAHIYIEQLHKRIKSLQEKEAEIAELKKQNEKMESRLTAMEGLMAGLSHRQEGSRL